MGRVAIVTDSTSDLPPARLAEAGITVVPLNVHFGTEVYRDQVDLSADDFYARLTRSPKLPTTSQPSPGLFEETFRRLAADHDGVVAILLASKLSGTVASATVARQALADVVPIEIVDSLNVSLGLGFQALRAADLAATGSDAPGVARRLRAATDRVHFLFFADTLEYLQRGGRIGKAASLVGSLIQLKPLLRLEEGQVIPYERTRTRARAVQGLVDFVQSLPHVERLGVLHSTTPADAERMADRLGEVIPRDRIVVARFGPVVGTHLGPGGLGVAVDEGEAG